MGITCMSIRIEIKTKCIYQSSNIRMHDRVINSMWWMSGKSTWLDHCRVACRLSRSRKQQSYSRKWIWERECKWIHCHWGRKKLYKSRVPTHRRAKQNDAYRTTVLSTMDSQKFIESCSTRRWKCTMRSMMIDGTSTNASSQKSEECSSN